jgi:hypothetical protein
MTSISKNMVDEHNAQTRNHPADILWDLPTNRQKNGSRLMWLQQGAQVISTAARRLFVVEADEQRFDERWPGDVLTRN